MFLKNKELFKKVMGINLNIAKKSSEIYSILWIQPERKQERVYSSYLILNVLPLHVQAS